MSRFSLLLLLAITFALGAGAGWLTREATYPPPPPPSPIKKVVAVPKPETKPPPPPVAVAPPPPVQPQGNRRSAKEIIEQLLVEMENSDPNRKGAFSDSQMVAARLLELQLLGEEASAAIRDFLRTNEDVSLSKGKGGKGGKGGHLTDYPSIRAAMLEVLYEMKDPTATAANLDVIKSSFSGLEIELAARNLEKNYPGVYRNNVIQALSELLNKKPDTVAPVPEENGKESKKRGAPKKTDNNLTYAFDIVEYYQARELIPQVEAVILSQADQSSQYNTSQTWMSILKQFGANEQASFVRRLLENEKTRSNASNLLHQLDIEDPNVQQLYRDTFAAQDPKRKEYFIQSLNSGIYGGGIYGNRRDGGGSLIKGAQKSDAKKKSDAPKDMGMSISSYYDKSKSRIEVVQRLLNEFSSQLTTPEQQEAYKKAQEQIQQHVQNMEKMQQRAAEAAANRAAAAAAAANAATATPEAAPTAP